MVSSKNLFSSFSVTIFLRLGLGTHLFVKVPRPGENEGNFSVFESSCTCYYLSNHSKVEAIPVKWLAQEHNKRTCRSILTLSLFNAERQAGKL